MRPEWKSLALAGVLVSGIVATSVKLVTTTHESRRLFQELETLQQEEDRLQGIWTALELEASTLADYGRIDEFARDELGMVEPAGRTEYVLVRQ